MAKSEKLFTVAGTATYKGVTKVRFANDLVARIKILNKAGCTDINLVELPQAMTKLDALRHLHSIGFTQGEVGYAVENKMAEKSRDAKRGEVKVQAKGKSVVGAKPAKAKSSVTAQQLVEAVKDPA